MTFDLAGFLGLRLNEHALHTGDIEVVLDPSATVSSATTAIVVDNLELIARFTGKPTGTDQTVHVHTREPIRSFTIILGPESVALTHAENGQVPDVELPAKAFIRLVYGRLAPDHTPPMHGTQDLDSCDGRSQGCEPERGALDASRETGVDTSVSRRPPL